MARRTLYLIDGHAQIYRAYYARIAPLTSPSGEPTKAVHIFVQMLLNLLRDRKPDYLAMTMDVSDTSVFRVKIDPEYKANRDASPEDLGPQIERIVSILQAMKVPILRREGYEADDLMATLCRRHARDDLDVFLVSKDKDLDQLLGDHVRMYDPPPKDCETDVATMIKSKGYGPEQAVEAQMLMGDSSDNIKGVLGVGPKKAAQLLQKYGTVADIIDHADELTPKLRENMRAFRERMDTVRRLVTLDPDVAIDFDLDEADIERFDPAAAAPILSELGLKRLLERIGGGAGGFALPDTEQASRPGNATVVSETTLFGEIQSTDIGASGRYELIDSDRSLAEFAAKLKKVSAFAFDTETTSLVAADADLVGISIAYEVNTGCYIPLRGIGRTVSEAAVRKHLGPIFADEKIRKCGQNLKYDVGVLLAFGLEVRGIDFDTMIASFVIEPGRRSHGIDALAEDLLHFRKIPTVSLIGKGKEQTTFDKLPTEQTCDYAAEDADIAWQLRVLLEKGMTEPELRSLFYDLELPLLEVLARMEHNGIAVDTDLL
ncbi:MAG: 5'-3' exonuclease H3TH domain-containing protein, partial [Phycisphaerae bacterium]